MQGAVADLAQQAASAAFDAAPSSPEDSLKLAEVELAASVLRTRAHLVKLRSAEAFTAAQTVGVAQHAQHAHPAIAAPAAGATSGVLPSLRSIVSMTPRPPSTPSLPCSPWKWPGSRSPSGSLMTNGGGGWSQRAAWRGWCSTQVGRSMSQHHDAAGRTVGCYVLWLPRYRHVLPWCPCCSCTALYLGSTCLSK